MCLILHASEGHSETNTTINASIDALIQKVNEKRLYNDRYWKVLLHYKPYRFGIKSLIDDPKFFLSPEGKKDPKAELEATLRAFFKSDKGGDENPRCRFIARYEWLKKKLDIEESITPDIVCTELENMIRAVQPTSAVLVFPAAFMNNPASMFGHTLLRIDGPYESKLLSFAANYAADPGVMDILYPFKGIFGFYKGYFNLFPYYDRIKMYNDTEQRDMWEYSLNLTESEVRKMFMHLWELKGIYSYYYFFDENCSYNLLFLLEAARPGLRLTDDFGLWSIPVDTIRVVERSAVVEGIDYRPAKATRIKFLASIMDEEARERALDIADSRLVPSALPDAEEEDKVKVLDLATEVIQYRYYKGLLEKDEYQRLFLATLIERSKSGIPEDTHEIPTPKSPEKGHHSSRIGLGIGVEDGRLYQDISIRPAYHSLTDPDDGYLDGSQIVVANTRIRYYIKGKVRLESLDLINIASITPRDSFFQPISFKIKTGYMHKIDKDNKEFPVYYFEPGIGLAFKNKYMGTYYLLVESGLNTGKEFKDHYAIGVGLWAGMIRKINESWKVNLFAETFSYAIRERLHENRISAVQTFKLNQNNGLNLSASWNEMFQKGRSEIALNWYYYF